MLGLFKAQYEISSAPQLLRNTFCLRFELRMHYQKKNTEKRGWAYCSFIEVLK